MEKLWVDNGAGDAWLRIEGYEEDWKDSEAKRLDLEDSCAESDRIS